MKKFSLFLTNKLRGFLFTINMMKRSGVEHQDPIVEQSPADSELSPTGIDKLVAEITTLLEEHQIYRQPDLDLKLLSERVQVPRYLVTRAINEGLGVNFYDLVNRYRVEAVKSMLISQDNKRYTLVSVAFAAGFNSKTTFNTVFKRMTGLTPSSYRNQHCRLGCPGS